VDAREEVANHARRLIEAGLVVGTTGNLSVRDGNRIAITPTAVPYEELAPEQVALVALDGTAISGRPSRELPLHLAVYRELEEDAVVHTHSPWATALACAADELPAVHYLAAELGGSVRVAPYATPGSAELAEGVLSALNGRSAALLASHGAVTVGKTLEQAFARTVLLEWLCALYARASSLGEPRFISSDELERLRDLVQSYGRAGRGSS
jgi:L-fuculose-phosphate aldolase